MVDQNNHRKRVCFLGGARYSQPLDATTEKKFRALAALGNMFVIGFSTDSRPRLFTQHARFYLLPKLRVRLLRQGLMLAVGPLLGLWCVLRHGVRILVTQGPYEGSAMAWAKIVARFLGCRVALVVETHGDFEESVFLYRRVFLPKLRRLLMRNVARFTFRHADVLRSISNATQQQQERWAPGKQVFQFITWTDIDTFLEASSDPGAPRPPNILYAGVLTPLKGVHHLVTAYARLTRDFPQARLILVGRQENKAYADQLRTQIQRLGLDGQVQFVGQVSQAELATWMSQACVSVLPSLSEGLGRVVVEAMAARTPVIGSRVGGIPQMIEDGVTGFLVQPRDESGLTEKLRWVLEHPVRARKMGDIAHAFARRFFSTEAYVEGYRQVFASAQRFLDR